MLNYKKILSYVVTGLAFVAMPLTTYAAYNDTTLTSDVVLNIGGITLTVSGSDATIESIAVDTDNFTVAMQSGSTMTVASADKDTFNISPGTGSYTPTTTCTADGSTLTVTASNAVTLIISPLNVACDASTSNSGGGGGAAIIPSGGGGGGGGGMSSGLGSSVYLNSDANTQVTVSVPTVTAPSMWAFTRRLMLGIKGDDVKLLQQLLNKDVETRIAVSGVGSLGHETTYFGLLTEKAVQRFQLKYGVVVAGTTKAQGFGIFGPKTQAKLKVVSGM